MMILFLGSGVSVESGLPSVVQITNRLLNDTYYYDENSTGSYYSAKHKDLQHLKPMREVQQLLKLLNELDEHYLGEMAPYWSGSEFLKTGSIYRKETSYEDLFYLAEQIRMAGMGQVDDAPIGAFIDVVERKAGNILGEGNRASRLISLYHLAVEASRFIEWMVTMSLDSECIKGLDLVIEIAESKRIERLDIVTLNHDTLVEQILIENNISFVDGFSHQDGDIRWQEDNVYDSKDAKVRLIKPHGSVNWYKFSLNGKERYAMIDKKDPTQCKNQKGETLKNSIKTPSFLSGRNKIISYNRGIYTDVFYRFHRVLRENDLMVMSGYGWGDTAINLRLENWVDYNKNNRLVLLHETPEELMSRSFQLDRSYNGWLRVGQLVPVPQWLCNTSLSDLTRQINMDR